MLICKEIMILEVYSLLYSLGNSVQRSAKRQYYNSSRLSIDPQLDMNLVNELKRK